MNEDWKNPKCKRYGKKYRIQDLHVCEPKKDETVDLLFKMFGMK